jgi:hypothetical protein
MPVNQMLQLSKTSEIFHVNDDIDGTLPVKKSFLIWYMKQRSNLPLSKLAMIEL